MQNIELEENDSSVEEVKKVLSLPEKDMYER